MTDTVARPTPITPRTAHRFVLPDTPIDLKARVEQGEAVAWRAPVTYPTYATAEPDLYPMFLGRRVYQGSSGRTYPLPFIDRISQHAEDREWDAIHLENRYLRVMILPELGGRIQIGYDKTTGYDFFYRNNVIKPALVGLAGPWVSGGVEFNWPQHHRPATYLPVETHLSTEEDDGSVVVWCSDHDPLQRMKGMHGVRLHPDRAIIQVDVRLHNRTSHEQTFLWWANVAAPVGDDYQSFFPTDVRYVADHARRAITRFPAADRSYYGVDYAELARAVPGSDRIDFYRNIPVPTSYMIVDSAEDFFGGYDHGRQAGFVHWADHRFAPGKKQWTWGDAPFGHAWDAQLTDSDGPYIELMAGVYSDNQPDFSFLQPGETKTFSQYWYPISEIGVAHYANRDAAIHLEVEGENARLGIATTSPLSDVTVTVSESLETNVLWETVSDITPDTPLIHTLPVGGARTVAVQVYHGGRRIAEYQVSPDTGASADEPRAATEPPMPESVDSVEELFLIGVHLRQNRHPTRSPLPYWQEALRRDPADARTNLAVAEHYLHTGEYDVALGHAQRAIARQSTRNGNPASGAGHYLLGLILRRLQRTIEASNAFAKAEWDGKHAHAARFERYSMAARVGATSDLHVHELLRGDTDDLRARALAAVLLRRSGQEAEAQRLLTSTIQRDPLDTLSRVLTGGALPTDGRTLIDVGLDFERFGEIDAALRLLSLASEAPTTPAGNIRPIAHYHRARVLDLEGRYAEAEQARSSAQREDRRWVFPVGLDDLDTLNAAVASDPRDAGAYSLLGMLFLDAGREADASAALREAIRLGDDNPVTLRNAAVVAFNHDRDDDFARESYRRAREAAPDDARLLYETDQLARRLGDSASARVARLDAARSLVDQRDDLTVEYCDLLIETGRAGEAIEILTSRSFQVWEGGEGRLLSAFDRARAELGLAPADPPTSLGEGRPMFTAPPALRDDGSTDYFATSLPALMLFTRE